MQGLTSPGAIPAGHVGSPSRGHPRRRPPGLSRGEACLGSASGVLDVSLRRTWLWGAAGMPRALVWAGMAAYPQQPVTVGSRPERLEIRSLATSSAQVGWMPTVRITCA